MNIKEFLKIVEILKDLNENDIETLSQTGKIEEYQDGSLILKRGEIGRYLWIVYEGKVEVGVPAGDGTKKTISTLERGDIFGEMSIMTGEPTNADIIASGFVKVVKIPRETFSEIIIKNPKTLGKVAKIITSRMVQREIEKKTKEELAEAHTHSEDPYDLKFSSVIEPTKVLVINCGSSSLKYSLFDTSQTKPLFEGLIERIGSPNAFHKMKTPQGPKERNEEKVKEMKDAFYSMVWALTHPEFGAIKSMSEIDAVGHRVAHGGSKFSSAAIIDDSIIGSIRAFYPLAPLHNPYNLSGIETIQKILPQTPQVAVFDTAFHQTIPDSAYTYALPYELCETEQIRRYGFHGTNHKYVSLCAAQYLKRPVGELKIISCHLGNGASVCAIDHGRSIDTSMGMTPLEGLIMGTRVGDIDPGALLSLMRNTGMSVEDVDKILNKESGLRGISGKSNDMREILENADAGDMRCKRAVSTFCYRVKKYIGAYMAILGGLDALIFTGGIGENAPTIRAMICSGLEKFGIVLMNEANQKPGPARGEVLDISEPGSGVRVLVIPADEERMIARETLHTLGRTISQNLREKLKSREIPVSISAHHVHLSQHDFEILFGKGKTLTPRTMLSQPGQFAAEETVNLIGPRGRVENVRILGPFRKETQIEISRTEEFKLGIDAPIRNSGDLEGTPGIEIEGPAGRLKLQKGVICARRHIHMSPQEALSLGLRDYDVVMVKVRGPRELIFGDVLVRVHPDFVLDMHIDTDEGNAAEISPGARGVIEQIQHRAYT